MSLPLGNIWPQGLTYTDYIICIVSIIFGGLSFVFAQIVGIGQLVSLAKTKNTSGTSIWTFLFFWFGNIICMVFALGYYWKTLQAIDIDANPQWYVLKQWSIVPLCGFYIFDLIFGLTLVIVKARHMSLAKKLHMSELELADYLLKKNRNKFYKTHEIQYKKYTWVAIVVAFAYVVVICFTVFFPLYVNPTYVKNQDENKWIWLVVLNFLCAFSYEITMWPSFIKAIKTKDTSGVSIPWAVFFPISLVVSFVYALSLGLVEVDAGKGFGADGAIPTTIGALVFNGLIVNIGMLSLKVKNIRRAKKLGMTELEYAQKYLAKKQIAKAKKKR